MQDLCNISFEAFAAFVGGYKAAQNSGAAGRSERDERDERDTSHSVTCHTWVVDHGVFAGESSFQTFEASIGKIFFQGPRLWTSLDLLDCLLFGLCDFANSQPPFLFQRGRTSQNFKGNLCTREVAWRDCKLEEIQTGHV